MRDLRGMGRQFTCRSPICFPRSVKTRGSSGFPNFPIYSSRLLVEANLRRLQ